MLGRGDFEAGFLSEEVVASKVCTVVVDRCGVKVDGLVGDMVHDRVCEMVGDRAVVKVDLPS